MTRDKLDSILRKYKTLITANVDVKTADGFIVRMFCMGYTKKLPQSHCNHTYAQQAKRRQIRDAMIQTMTQAAEASTVEVLSKDLVEEKIENKIVEQCKNIFQIEAVYITKVKVIKAPALSAEQVSALQIPQEALQTTAAPRPSEK
jgi:small subunit ribosomal protein S3Ae